MALIATSSLGFELSLRSLAMLALTERCLSWEQQRASRQSVPSRWPKALPVFCPWPFDWEGARLNWSGMIDSLGNTPLLVWLLHRMSCNCCRKDSLRGGGNGGGPPPWTSCSSSSSEISDEVGARWHCRSTIEQAHTWAKNALKVSRGKSLTC